MAKALNASAEIRNAAERIKMLSAMPAYQLPKGQKTLRYYAAVGDVIGALDRTYKNKTIPQLIKLLYGPKASGSTLYKAVRFAEAIGDGDLNLDKLELGQISWREASRLMSRHLDVTKRKQLVRDAASGKVGPKDFGKSLNANLSPDAMATTRSLKSARDRAVNAIIHLKQVKHSGSEPAAKLLEEVRQKFNEV